MRGVGLGGFGRVTDSVFLVPLRDLRMNSRFLVRTVLVMTGRLTMMASCMLMMVCSAAVMVGGFLRHMTSARIR